jgi:hypothetical protein
MARKAAKPMTIAPLQFVFAEPITDPAEQAALDDARKRQRRKKGGQNSATTKGKNHAPASAHRRRPRPGS